METYTAMRQFADSWGLLGMVIVFLIAVWLAFRPGVRKQMDDAASIPFKDYEQASKSHGEH